MSGVVSVLGTSYEIRYLSQEDDERLENYNGYCDAYSHLIIISTDKDGDIHDYKVLQRKVLRHEIVHAFLHESGLDCNSQCLDSPWATNEEMVDWIALQGEKIYRAWEEAGAIG